MDITSRASALLSCSMKLLVSPTRTFLTGTGIWSGFARTSPSFSPATRSTSRIVRLRLSPLYSTARRTCNTTTSPPSPTITSRSHSSGLQGSLLVPPEVTMDPQWQQKIEQDIKEAQETALPEDDEA